MHGFVFVGLGGAVGAILRYTISLIPVKMEFPILTLITNLLGAVLIGFVVGKVAVNSQLNPNVSLFLKTGVCGGFTTFSTFSLEALQMLEQGKIVPGGVYILLSVMLCIVGVYVGRMLA